MLVAFLHWYAPHDTYYHPNSSTSLSHIDIRLQAKFRNSTVVSVFAFERDLGVFEELVEY